MFCLFRVLMSEMLGRLLPVLTLLLWQCQHIIVVDAVDNKYSAPSVYRPPFYRQNSRLSRFPPLKIPCYTAKLSYRHPPQVFGHKSCKTNLNAPVSTAHNYLLTAVYWSVIMECILYFFYICMFQFKIALHLETYWKTKHDTFGFRYLEQVLYLDSLLEKNGSFMQKHLFLFYWIQLPQWHHTKALFLFYTIKLPYGKAKKMTE